MNNDKQRFTFNEDKTLIRANQGHSIQNIDIELTEKKPPLLLYHGTVEKCLFNIKTEGLKKMTRQYVHLSISKETAEKVGSRRGKAIILHVNAKDMFDKGHTFYLSKNEVWLTDHIPPEFINFKNRK